MVSNPLQADKEPIPKAIWALGALFFLGVWALRLATLHPAFHPDDSPEITAAMTGLGIAHPPGYPLPTLLGRIADLLLPGAPAFASNCLAALGSVLSLILALILARRLTPKEARAWLLPAALGLALMPQLWFQGQSSKGGLYTLNLALTLGAMLCLLDGRALALGWFLCGLGLAGHYMSFVLFLPVLAYASWQARPGLRAQAELWAWMLPGLALYLYLPIRAGFHPAMNWGDPSSFARLKAVLLRQMYSGAESGQDLNNAAHLGGHFLTLWVQQWHWAGLALAALGIAPLWRSGRPARLLLLGLALHLGVVLAYNHPPQNAPWVINAFFLPTFTLGAVLILQGCARIEAWLPEQGRRLWFGGVVAGLVLIAPARFRANDFHQDYLLHDYAHDLLLAPIHGSVMLAAGGDDAFPVWYLQQVQGRRRDLTLVDVPLVGSWYLDQLRPRIPDWNPAWMTKDQVTQGLLGGIQEPLYYSSHNPGDRGIPLGLVSLVPPQNTRFNLSVQGLLGPWQATRLRWASDRRTPSDGNREELLAYYPDSAAALAQFGRQQGVAPLAQAGEQLQARLRGAIAP
jgi:hypothetical protein